MRNAGGVFWECGLFLECVLGWRVLKKFASEKFSSDKIKKKILFSTPGLVKIKRVSNEFFFAGCRVLYRVDLDPQCCHHTNCHDGLIPWSEPLSPQFPQARAIAIQNGQP